MGHTFSRILLHVVFSTKARRNTLYPNMRGELLRYIHGIAHNLDAQLLEANAVDDHVHMLLSLKPAHAPSDVVKKIKANSSRWLHQTYPDLQDFAWQSGFSVFSVSESLLPEVTAYIQNQEQHHKRMQFAEELRLLLEKHRVQYDPEHYLD